MARSELQVGLTPRQRGSHEGAGTVVQSHTVSLHQASPWLHETSVRSLVWSHFGTQAPKAHSLLTRKLEGPGRLSAAPSPDPDSKARGAQTPVSLTDPPREETRSEIQGIPPLSSQEHPALLKEASTTSLTEWSFALGSKMSRRARSCASACPSGHGRRLTVRSWHLEDASLSHPASGSVRAGNRHLGTLSWELSERDAWQGEQCKTAKI